MELCYGIFVGTLPISITHKTRVAYVMKIVHIQGRQYYVDILFTYGKKYNKRKLNRYLHRILKGDANGKNCYSFQWFPFDAYTYSYFILSVKKLACFMGFYFK